MEEERSKLPVIIVSILIVLVILAILFVVFVYPNIIEKKKMKFKDDSLKMYEGALVLQQNLLNDNTNNYNKKTVMCFSSDYLKNMGALEGEYTGSVLATYSKKENQMKYYVWIANKDFMLLEKTKNEIDVGNIALYDKSLADNIDHCPINLINFDASNEDYLYCNQNGCTLDIKPEKTKYCKEGEDTGNGCLITTYVTCRNDYEMEANLDCVSKENPEFMCEDGYYLDGNICKMETDSKTCETGKIVDGKCLISIPAKLDCYNGNLVGNVCIDRYKLCEGTYDKENYKCDTLTDYSEGYSCPSGYTYSNYRCVKE